MVPAVTMQIDAIPLNQNQKVNKKALPKPDLSEKLRVKSEEFAAAPLNVLEEELHEMIASIVNTKDFGITTILGYAGLTSISAIKLAVQVNKRYGVTLDSKSLVKTGTLQSIENEILKQMMAGGATPAEEGSAEANSSLFTLHSLLKSVPLSYAQTGVYFECLKNPETTLYNIPTKIGFPKDTDAAALIDAIKALVKSHPQMTTYQEQRLCRKVKS